MKDNAEPGNISSKNAPTVEAIKIMIIISNPSSWLTLGMPNIVAKVLGIAITNVIHVRINITPVRMPKRLFSLSLEAINCTIAVIIRSSCFSILRMSFSNFSSEESSLKFYHLHLTSIMGYRNAFGKACLVKRLQNIIK